MNDRFVLRSRSHQGGDRQINVSCIVAGCYPQDTHVRVVETTIVILQLYSDSDGIVPSAKQDHKTSYIDDITKLLQIKIKFKSFVAKHPNIKLPTGVLLCGPPGVGKTWSVKQSVEKCNCLFQNRASFKLFLVDGAEIFNLSRSSGEGEAKLRSIFGNARAHAYSGNNFDTVSIVFIDEIDVLCPHRGEGNSTSTRFVAQLLTLMDGVHENGINAGNLYVFGATNRPDDLDEALRRPGRFDREIRFKTPSLSEKVKALRYHCQKLKMPDVFDFEKIAKHAVGFTGADLSALCRQAALKAAVSGSDIDEVHFTSEIKLITPSTTRGEHFYSAQKLKLSWDNIGGLEDVKRQVRRAIEWPFSRADALARMGIEPPRGLIMHGPPGCAKTTIARTAAAVSNASFITLSGGDMYSAFVGESERLIRATFHKARQALPAIIFLDEIDAIVGKRDFGSGGEGADEVQTRILSTLLNEMDGISKSKQLLVIAATNRIDMVDPALLRPGRFDQHIHVPLPNSSERQSIMRALCRKINYNNRNTVNHADNAMLLDVEALIKYAGSDSCEEFSGADLKNLLNQSLMSTMRSQVKAIKS